MDQIAQQDGALAELGADLEEVATQAMVTLEPVELDEDAGVEGREPSGYRVQGEEVGRDAGFQLLGRVRSLVRRLRASGATATTALRSVVMDELVASPGDAIAPSS